MPYRVLMGHVTLECDSLDEAVEIAQRLSGETVGPSAKPHGSSPPAPGTSRWTEARFIDFFRTIKGQQRKLMDQLLEHPEGRTDSQLRLALGIGDNRQLGGVLAALWKNAKKVGAAPDELYSKKKVSLGNSEAFEYIVGEAFRKLAEKSKPL